MIWKLSELPESARPLAGGKAGTLAKLAQAGYPVPAGTVLSVDAFQNGGLQPDAWVQVAAHLAELRANGDETVFAVRSSALSEDSTTASFAGEFESILNVTSDDEIRDAVLAVYRSRENERVSAYSQAQGIAISSGTMAVLIQKMVPADLAGVLFTVDPVTGSQAHMDGNYVQGLGDRLVSGEASGRLFQIDVPSGAYHGPDDLEPFSDQLFELGQKLVRDLGGPQDIEWAIAEGKLALLQARPVTTVQPYNPATGEWNDSWRGEYLWSNANFGEVLPDVMTPLTWSFLQIYADEVFGNPLPGNNPLMGNISGRFYINLSLYVSVFQVLGFSRERMNKESEEFFGNLPENIDIPTITFSRWAVLRKFAPFAIKAIIRRARNLRELEDYTRSLPERCAAMQEAIEESTSPQEIAALWPNKFEAVVRKTCQMLHVGTTKYENAYRPLRRELADQVGETDANLLLSGVSEEGDQLASLGPLVGLWQVAQGQLSKGDYLQQYGHRGPHEFELAWPRPAEESDWIDTQLASLNEQDVPALLARRAVEKQDAWQRYLEQFPEKADETKRKLDEAAAAARDREAIRSEITRLLGVMREYALRAGELSGLGEDVFFLYREELVAVLQGSVVPEREIRARRETYARLSKLPPYPALIIGRFDPYSWAASTNRRTDIFDARARAEVDEPASNTVNGLPGSAGVVEGTVRYLANVEDGHLLKPGEILIATTTNVGWTPLFPRAAAVVTDVGAPLSHAAIVARELGIPAVIGTGDATMRLKTGDRVRVDGIQGTVEILDKVPA